MKQLTILTLVLVLFACQSKNKENAKVDTLIHKEYYGNWVGYLKSRFAPAFGSSYKKLNIRILSINKENIIEGQTIFEDVRCKLEGNFNDTTHKFILKEVSGNKSDRTFEFEINEDSLVGVCNAKERDDSFGEGTYKLFKTQFVYDNKLMLPELGYNYADFFNQKYTGEHPKGSGYKYRESSSVVLRLNASTIDLKEDSLKNLKKIDLEIIRNTIYARHGFIFKNETTRQYFNFVDWYVPLHYNVDSQLTALEVKNIAILKRFEKYAKENYHTFYR